MVTDNASTMIDLSDEFRTFQKYLRSHDSFCDLVKDLLKQFKFMGEIDYYYTLHIVREDVPDHDVLQTK